MFVFGRNPEEKSGSGFLLQSFCEKQKGFPLQSLSLYTIHKIFNFRWYDRKKQFDFDADNDL